MHSPLSETRLDDQETNELLCLPKPRKHKHFAIRKYIYIVIYYQDYKNILETS